MKHYKKRTALELLRQLCTVGSIIKGAGDTCWTGAMADNLSVTLVNNPENNATVDIIRCMSSRISDNVEDVDDWAANT